MIYEQDLFYQYTGSLGVHTVTCNKCGCLVPNEAQTRQSHVEYHNEFQVLMDDQR